MKSLRSALLGDLDYYYYIRRRVGEYIKAHGLDLVVQRDTYNLCYDMGIDAEDATLVNKAIEYYRFSPQQKHLREMQNY